MFRRMIAIALLVSATALGGCASNKAVNEMQDNNVSFVYGYIDMAEAPSMLGHFQLRKVKPKTDEPYWNIRTHDGVFYMENVPPGSYQISRFGGPGGFFSSASYYYYDFPRQSGGFRIDKPGVYFIGSYKYVDAGSWFNRKFDIEKIDSPSPQEVLERIMPFVTGTKWETRLRANLATGAQ